MAPRAVRPGKVMPLFFTLPGKMRLEVMAIPGSKRRAA